MDAGSAHRLGVALAWIQENAGCNVLVTCAGHEIVDAAPGVPANPADAAPQIPDDSRPVVSLELEGCISRTEPWILVDLAVASGGTVLLDTAPCPSPDPDALERLGQLTDGRVQVGTTSRKPGAALHLTHPPMSRRGIFRRGTSMPVVEHLSDDAQDRLVDSLRALGVGEVPGKAPALQLLVDGCIACGVCVKACPHDALELGTASNRSTLVHHVDRCQGERVCVAQCPSQAISVIGHHDWQPVLAGRPLPLARLATTTCQKCRSLIPQGQKLCAACAARAEDPFGVHLPDHLRDKLPAKWRDRLG